MPKTIASVLAMLSGDEKLTFQANGEFVDVRIQKGSTNVHSLAYSWPACSLRIQSFEPVLADIVEDALETCRDKAYLPATE